MFLQKMANLDYYKINYRCNSLNFLNKITCEQNIKEYYKGIDQKSHQKAKVFSDSILKSEVAEAIGDNLKIYNSRLNKNQPPRDIKSIFEFAIYKISTENEVVRYRLLKESSLPEKLYSIKEIINHYGYSSSMQAYRMIDKLGVKRYILDQFVRYDLSEFDRTSNSILKMDYKSYLDLSKNADVEKKIAEKALQYSQKLVQSGLL